MRWPTPEMLERAGFVRCQQEGCTTYLDPVNVRSRLCQAHRIEAARRRREQRFQHRPRVVS